MSVLSSWLQQYPIPVEVLELPVSASTRKTPSQVAALFSADVPIIVCNPLTTNLANVLADPSIPWTHSNAILVVTGSAAIPPSLLQRIRSAVPDTLTVLSVDPSRALSALQTLGAGSNSASSVQRYQDGFSESRVSDISTAISQSLAALGQTSDSGILGALRKQNALDLVFDSLNACRKAVKVVQNETDNVRRAVSSLQGQMEEFKAKIGVDVLGTQEKPDVKEALERAKLGVKNTMDKLDAWRMLWKVDDIADTVNASIDRSWCRDMESKVCFVTLIEIYA